LELAKLKTTKISFEVGVKNSGVGIDAPSFTKRANESPHLTSGPVIRQAFPDFFQKLEQFSNLDEFIFYFKDHRVASELSVRILIFKSFMGDVRIDEASVT